MTKKCPECGESFKSDRKKRCSTRCTNNAARRAFRERQGGGAPVPAEKPAAAPEAPPKQRGGRKPGTWDLGPEAFAAWRSSAKLSRMRLGKALGVSSTSIQSWETGNAVPVPKTQARIAELMAAPALPVEVEPGRIAFGSPTTLEAAGRELGAALGRFLQLLVAGVR